jgi:2-C-methyl-D-erythritol 4-phosphate cytidylyltransferase
MIVSLFLKMNLKVNLVEGDKMNFKITSAEDLTLLKAIVKMG